MVDVAFVDIMADNVCSLGEQVEVTDVVGVAVRPNDIVYIVGSQSILR